MKTYSLYLRNGDDVRLACGDIAFMPNEHAPQFLGFFEGRLDEEKREMVFMVAIGEVLSLTLVEDGT